MNNKIQEKLVLLENAIVPSRIFQREQYQDILWNDLKIILDAFPYNDKDYEQDESYFCNAFTDLVVKKYLEEFDFSNATQDQIDQVALSVGHILDKLNYKAIPYKHLVEMDLYNTGVGNLYYTTHLDRGYTYLSSLVKCNKGNSYPYVLEILIKNNCLDAAVKFYQTYSFFISPSFLIKTAKKYLDTESKIKTISKKFLDLIIHELEKFDLSLYKLQSKDVYDGLPKERDESGYSTFYNLCCQFESLMARAFYAGGVTFTPNILCEGTTGVIPNISDALDVYLNFFNGELEFNAIIMAFHKDVLEKLKNKDENGLMTLFGKTTREHDIAWQIGADVIYFLSALIHGITILLLDSKEDIEEYVRLCSGNSNKWMSRMCAARLVRNYLKQGRETRKFTADLIDLYINIKNFRTDPIDSDEMLDFVGILENRRIELEEENVNAIVSAYAKNLYIENAKKLDEICTDFFRRNGDNGKTQENAEAIYKRIDNMKDVKQTIASGELIFFPYREIDDNIVSGDLTGLITCQTKAVERYLKEMIIKYARSKGVWLAANSSDIRTIEPTQDNKIQFKDKDYYVVKIDEDANAMSLSSVKPGACTNVEIGPCIKFIKENIITKGASDSIFAYDKKLSDCPLYKNWVQKVRNPHMHVMPVESLKDVKTILAKTAYWLLKAIDELG